MSENIDDAPEFESDDDFEADLAEAAEALIASPRKSEENTGNTGNAEDDDFVPGAMTELAYELARRHAFIEADRVEALRYKKDPRKLPTWIVREKRRLEGRDAALQMQAESQAQEIEFATLGELMDDPAFLEPPQWGIHSWWVDGTFGMIGGPEKSFKSWTTACTVFSTASGLPLFNNAEMKVARSGPVIVYTGEGGKKMYVQRLWQIARGAGMSKDAFMKLPIHVTESRAGINTDSFKNKMKAMLQGTQAVLVVIDPLYTYMGADAEAGNVFSMGPRLNGLSDISVEAGAQLQICHHMTKLGTRGGCPTLTELTQSGSREWVGAWILSDLHDHDKVNNRFTLHLNAGGRDWDGSDYTLVVDMSGFDRESLQYIAPPQFTLTQGKPEKGNASRGEAQEASQNLLAMQQGSRMEWAMNALQALGLGQHPTNQVAVAVASKGEWTYPGKKSGEPTTVFDANSDRNKRDLRDALRALADSGQVLCEGNTKNMVWWVA